MVRRKSKRQKQSRSDLRLKGRTRAGKRIVFSDAQPESKRRIFIKSGQGKVTDDDIVGFILSNNGSATKQEILAAFDLGRSHRKGLDIVLQQLCQQKALFFDSNKTYSIQKADQFFHGTLSVNPRGFAFASLDPPHQNLADIFIAGRNTGTAMHGDQVLIKVLVAKGLKKEGRVIRVLSRNTSLIVGIYKAGKPVGLVEPEDDRFPFQVLVRRERSCGAKNGEAVVVQITEPSVLGIRNPKGDIVEVLGDPDRLDVQTEIVIRKYQLPHHFNPSAQQQLKGIDSKVEPHPDRLDLRDVLHITIDGETARDFDDAVAVEKSAQGCRLYVSIADVCHYVPEGSAVDDEAYQRGTSVYFPTRVVPMLPELLSNDLCSLVPNQDRYAFTAILDFDLQGGLTQQKFAKSIIRSHFRMTYNLVQGILDQESDLLAEYSVLIPVLEQMEDLGRKLLKKRMARGSIGFELPEANIVIGPDDRAEAIGRRERKFAHQIIEEFMLAANEAVARTMEGKSISRGLFRIHETPDPIKVGDFSQFAKTMGLELPDDPGTPQWFGKVLDLAKGTPQEYIVNNLLLRTMKKAMYSSKNVGHFGLAASHYCHFTSPIRRYPDLMVHRAMASFLSGGKGTGRQKTSNCDNDQEETKVSAGAFLSQRERLAVDAEREMVDRIKVCYMEDKIGECFEGIISGVTSFGLFIELLDSFISGGVAIKDLTDDYYHLDEPNHRLIGKRTNNVFQIGRLVRVRLASVEKARRRINFVIE